MAKSRCAHVMFKGPTSRPSFAKFGTPQLRLRLRSWPWRSVAMVPMPERPTGVTRPRSIERFTRA